MSIILDALKKAQKDRSPKEEGSSSSDSSNFVTPEPLPPKSNSKNSVLLLLMALIVVGGVFGWRTYNKMKTQAQSPVSSTPKLMPVVPKASPAPSEEKVDQMREEAMRLFEDGKTQESLNIWTKITGMVPTDAEAFNNMGVIQKKQGSKEDAKKSYEKALEINPDYPQALNNQGVLMAESGYVKEAKDLFKKAVTIDSTYAEPHYHLAVLSEKENLVEEALGYYESFILSSGENLESSLKNKVNMRIAVLRSKKLKSY